MFADELVCMLRLSLLPACDGCSTTGLNNEKPPALSWLLSLGLLQQQAYRKTNAKHTMTLSSLLTLFPSSVAPPSHTSTSTSAAQCAYWVFISSVADPAVDPALSDASIALTTAADGLSTGMQAWTYQASPIADSPGAPQNLTVLNKIILEAIFSALPGVLYTFSVPDLMLCALLSSQWSHSLMLEAYWRLGWGSRASARRSVLETLQACLQVLTVRLRPGHRIQAQTEAHAPPRVVTGLTVHDAVSNEQQEEEQQQQETREEGKGGSIALPIPRTNVVCYMEVLAAMLASLASAFLASSLQEERQLGSGAKFDLKTGSMLLDVCVQGIQVRQVLKKTCPQQASDVARREGVDTAAVVTEPEEWTGRVQRLCAYVSGKVGASIMPSAVSAGMSAMNITISEDDGHGGKKVNCDVDDKSCKSKGEGEREEKGGEEEEEEEFSDWDDSDSEDGDGDGAAAGGEGTGVDGKSYGGSSGGGGGGALSGCGNVSGNNFDVVLVHTSIRDIKALLA